MKVARLARIVPSTENDVVQMQSNDLCSVLVRNREVVAKQRS